MAIIPTPPPPQKPRKHGNPEAKLQSDCHTWLWNNHPETRLLYFATFNESSVRYLSKKEQEILGAQRNARGLVAGVSDSILLMPCGIYHGLLVEFKTEIGRQSDAQKVWQAKVESVGYKYILIRSLEEFKQKVTEYLNLQTK